MKIKPPPNDFENTCWQAPAPHQTPRICVGRKLRSDLAEAQTQTVLGKEAMAVGVTGSDTGWQDRDERRGGAN